jgi:hypothetical protein
VLRAVSRPGRELLSNSYQQPRPLRAQPRVHRQIARPARLRLVAGVGRSDPPHTRRTAVREAHARHRLVRAAAGDRRVADVFAVAPRGTHTSGTPNSRTHSSQGGSTVATRPRKTSGWVTTSSAHAPSRSCVKARLGQRPSPDCALVSLYCHRRLAVPVLVKAHRRASGPSRPAAPSTAADPRPNRAGAPATPRIQGESLVLVAIPQHRGSFGAAGSSAAAARAQISRGLLRNRTRVTPAGDTSVPRHSAPDRD